MCRMFLRMFQCFCKKADDEYTASGVVFTNGVHILAGYQPNKKKPCISGIGGRKKPGETYFETAIRELVEELFEIYTIPQELLQDIREQMLPKKIIRTEGYVNHVYTFSDLQTLLILMKKHSMESELYKEMPSNISELVFNRTIVKKQVEISHICILPLVKHDSTTQYIDPCFLSDFPIGL